jgi:2-aminomuconate deaminase
MRAILKTAGGDLANLVDMSVFLTDMSMYKAFNSVYNEYFDAQTGPSRTTVGVATLPGPHLLIEMKGVAYIP